MSTLQQQETIAAEQRLFEATEMASALLRILPDGAKALSLADLLRVQVELETLAKLCKLSLEIVRYELRSRTAAHVDKAIEDENKQSGTFNFTHDGMPLKAEIDKEVEWDTAKLMPVAGAMDWPAAQKIFKFQITVPEAIYKTLPATMSLTPELAELLKQIEAARSVKYGKPKITARI